MKTEAHKTIRLKDYQPTPFLIDKVRLNFALDETDTRVTSEISFRPNPAYKKKRAALELDGEMVTLHSVSLNGIALGSSDYKLTASKLVITKVPQKPFTLRIENSCAPKANTALSGLYMSNGIYCTQCEAEGFRRITYFYDRPDVMAKFHVRIEAPRKFPVLLSNGNPAKRGKIKGNRHFAEWNDPHPKPSYLFALVAGDLASVKSSFTTARGRKVKLGIYVEQGKQDRCAWAMQSLKTSMRWDETRFGRLYDLDEFNIVAVSDFNMGAMENKGLNIFNDKYILARPETATDTDYELIEAIIAHEYFHNWTGNRITCRDWFQLCLKEGLTVFRDQEFTSDLRSRALKRIEDVQDLRSRQFPEDMGPLQHPVRPDNYIEINNFYTSTVYEKGAELCRMMLTLLGRKKFDKAMALYFKRHDGDAATVEDFVTCMADASGRDMKQFMRWYNQAGTPRVSVISDYNVKAKRFDIEVKQDTPRLKGQQKKLPFLVPLRVGLLDKNGNDINIKSPLIELKTEKQKFSFSGISEKPVLSINREFSAPISLKQNLSTADHLFLMAHDSDSFNRWEASQVLGQSLILESYHALSRREALPNTDGFADALARGVRDTKIDPAFKATLMQLPLYDAVAAEIGRNVDSDILFSAREHVRTSIARRVKPLLIDMFERSSVKGKYKPSAGEIGKRTFHFSCLGLASGADEKWAAQQALREFRSATNMTVEFNTLNIAMRLDQPEGDDMMAQFYKRHKSDSLLLNKWFSVQSGIPGPTSAARVRKLMDHPDFTLKTPNRVYALLGGFIHGNMTGFHAGSGAGYALAADAILQLDAINPQVASRLAKGFESWRLFDAPRRVHAQVAMNHILKAKPLSPDVYEIISRTLKA